jgi:prevent-host-death family protein
MKSAKASRSPVSRSLPATHTRPTSTKRSSFTATEAKNEFGLLLERAISGEAVVITKHETPKAVLISMDEYHTLKCSSPGILDELTAEYDAMLAEMQTRKSRDGVRDLFSSTPEQLGRAAVNGVKQQRG